MSDFLVDYAIRNFWCTPDQDKQAIIKPKRISGVNGVWIDYTLMMRKYSLPNKTSHFHIFSIGQVFPSMLGFFPYNNVWKSLELNSNNLCMLATVYTTSGLKIPASTVYYRYTEDRALILAIEVKKQFNINYGTTDFYLQVYSDAFFNSERANSQDHYIKVESLVPSTQNEILQFQLLINTYRNKLGTLSLFINGKYVNNITIINTKVGDFIELIYDGSVEKVVDLPVANLKNFDSDTTVFPDLARRFLLHYTQAGDEVKTIRFLDDVDFYLIKKDNAGNFTGTFFHKNAKESFRMVTHRDYSVSVDVLTALAAENNWNQPNELTLRMVIKNSGYLRDIVFESSKLHELYKLRDTDITDALLGEDSLVSAWRATYLETAMYQRLMGFKREEVTQQKSQDALGYDAIANLLGATPSRTEIVNNGKTAYLKPGLTESSTVLEYNAEGEFIGAYEHSGSDAYRCRNDAATYVEALVGEMDDGFDENYDSIIPLDPKLSYGFYYNAGEGWTNGVDAGFLAVANNVATWIPNNVDTMYTTRSNKKIMVREISLKPSDNVFKFTLMQNQTQGGVIGDRPSEIQPGFIYIFLNGSKLVEGLDYQSNYPEFYITNKKYLKNAGTDHQRVTVVCGGIAAKDLVHRGFEETGFVQFNELSMNSYFNLRDDRVMRISVDGKLYLKNEIRFAEDTVPSGELLTNGLPYQVEEIIVPVNSVTTEDTYVLQEKITAVNKEISDYLTTKIPEPTHSGIVTIPNRHYLYSPFLTSILHDLIHGVLADERLKGDYSTDLVQELCQPYLKLLAFDPCHDSHFPDMRYVYIHPHPLSTAIDINAYQFKFLSWVIKLYLKDRVQISDFLRLVF